MAALDVQAQSEGFESTTFPPTEWVIQNASSPIGTNTNCWNRFTSTPWAPHSGLGHAGANFNCTGGGGTISGWLISPELSLQNGNQITFWTRKASPDIFPDRLELRLSTNGPSTNTGGTADSVGDFTTLLVSVNPTLVTGVYPTTFTQFTGTISGLTIPTSGRFAFRYYVTNGGPGTPNSDIISIDDVQFSDLVPTAANVSVSGRVLSVNGRGIPGATVVITGTDGISRITQTSTFGYYMFYEVIAGDTYIVEVRSKQYTFAPRLVSVDDNLEGFDFVAEP